MKKILLLLTCLTCAGPLCAKEIKMGAQWPELRAANGKVFTNVKFTFVSPREVRFMHDNGIGSLLLSDVASSEDVTVHASPPSTTLGPLGVMMSPEERKLSGIDKLNNQEQTTLAAWVKKAIDERVREEHAKVDPKNAVLGQTAISTGVTTAPAGVAASPTAPAPTPTTLAEPMTITIKATLPPPPPPLEELPPEEALAAMLTPLTPPRSSPALLPPPVEPMDQARKRVAAKLGVVETRIQGEFRGFETGQKFQLANGQLWRQHEAFLLSHSAFEPSVMIYPVDGGWMMKVDGVEKAVRVIPYPRETVADSAGLARR